MSTLPMIQTWFRRRRSKRRKPGSCPPEGWFVLNARVAHWRNREGRGKSLPFEGPTYFPQVGITLFVLGPGEPIGMYHWEADQEDFLVLSGEGLLIVEGEERALQQWDFVHCPAGTKHIIVGAGAGSCVVLAVGAREHQRAPTGAATRSTRSRSGMAPGSSRRQLTRCRPTPGFQSPCRRDTTRAGSRPTRRTDARH